MQIKIWMLKLIATYYINKLKLINFEDDGLSQKAKNKLEFLGGQKIGYKGSQKNNSRGRKKRR